MQKIDLFLVGKKCTQLAFILFLPNSGVHLKLPPKKIPPNLLPIQKHFLQILPILTKYFLILCRTTVQVHYRSSLFLLSSLLFFIVNLYIFFKVYLILILFDFIDYHNKNGIVYIKS